MGPTVADVRRMLEATSGDTEGETRDYAIVLTFYCLGLRVAELCGLTLEETDLARGTTWVKGKGRRKKELLPLPPPVVQALRRYLRWRGQQAGPLFQTRGQRGNARDGGGRLLEESRQGLVDAEGRRESEGPRQGRFGVPVASAHALYGLSTLAVLMGR